MMEDIKISGAPCVSISIRLRYDRNGNTFYRVQRADYSLGEHFGCAAFSPMKVDATNTTPNEALGLYVSRIVEAVGASTWWAGPWVVAHSGQQKSGSHRLPCWVAISTGGVQ